MNRLLRGLFFAALLGSVGTPQAVGNGLDPQSFGGEQIDWIVAVVAQEPITYSLIRLEARLQGLGEPTLEVEREILRRLIRETLLLQAAAQFIVVTDREVEEELIRRAAPLSVETYLESWRQQGIVEADLRERVRESLAVREFLDREFRPRLVRPTEELLRNYYQQHRDRFAIPARVLIRQLWVYAPRADGEQAWNRAQALAEELRRDPSAFERLRDQPVEGIGIFSEPVWVPVENFSAPIRQALEGAELDQWIGPFQSAAGSVLIHLVGREAVRYRPFETVRDEVRAAWEAEELDRLVEEWIQGRRRQVEVRILDPNFAAAEQE
ncbi:MAG: hypothetical protein KatS3mg115_2225 [Candidatus Poribacteria bacterium]|nr:MAG: hypothetical protein KatS3mg115_2225 [Candidatus Poribacteria bacterium]